MTEKLLSDMSDEDKTDVIKDLIVKYIKFLDREPEIRRKIEEDKVTLAEIRELYLKDAPLSPDCPCDSYQNWKKLLEKGISASQKSLRRMDEFKTKVEGLQFFINSNLEVSKV